MYIFEYVIKRTRVASFFLVFSILAAGSVLSKEAASAEAFHPAIIYESRDGKGDSGFLNSVSKGAKLAHDEVGIDYKEYVLPEGRDRADFMAEVAEKETTHIIAVGFQNVVPVLSLADRFPEVKFTVIDGTIPPLFNNVQSITFKDHEGAFLVGMVAGYVSKTGKVGFIGGMDVPLISNFALGFYQGARYANPDIELIRDTVGENVSAWSNPERAKQLARKQYNSSGVDVIFAAAGGSSIGVLEAAEEMGKLAIGVDTNQNGYFPGTVLTSMVKRVDKVIYDNLTNSFSGRWEPGIKYLGIRDNVLDYAVDINNKDLISKEIIDKVEAAKDQIIRGQLKVEMYTPY